MKKINRYLIIVLGVILLSSCGGGESEEETDSSAKVDTVATGILVNTVLLSPKVFEHYIDISGVVEADQSVIVSSEAPGTVAKIAVKEGSIVKKGQILAYLNTAIIDSGIEEIKVSLALATTIFEKRKRLWDQQIGSELEFLQAKTNKQALESKLKMIESQKDQSIISSPINGTVEEIYTKQGELISPGIPFASIVNLQNIKVRSEVSEAYILYIKKGDSVKVSVPAIGLERNQRISRVGNVINPNNRTFPIEIYMSNNNGNIKLNAICMLHVQDYRKDAALAVPTEIVRQDAKGHYVFKVSQKDGESTAMKTYVEVGKTGVGETEILNGLAINDLIITDGYNEVGDGVKVLVNTLK